MAQRKSIADQLRAEMDRSRLSRYRMAKDAGIDESQLTGFYHGRRRLSLDSLDRLCQLLGLELRKRK